MIEVPPRDSRQYFPTALSDFATFAAHAGLPEAILKNILQKIHRKKPAAQVKIRQSLLSDDLRTAYRNMLEERLARLEGG